MSATHNEKINKFDGTKRQEWPEFERKMLAMGVVKGGWDDALEKEKKKKEISVYSVIT